MKRIIAFAFIILVMVLFLTSCNKKVTEEKNTELGEEVSGNLSDLDSLENELDNSDLEEFEHELENFDW